MATSPLLERLRPALQGARTIQWPGPIPEGMERPTITLHCLNGTLREEAYFATAEHFRELKRRVSATDPIFIMRERAEQLFRAARDAEGQPVAADVDALEKTLPAELRDILWSEWTAVQAEFSAGPHTEGELREIVEALKKNFPVDRLAGWPSSWLLRLLRIMAEPSSS